MKNILAFIVLAGIITDAVTANEPVQFIDARLKEVIEQKLRVTDPTAAEIPLNDEKYRMLCGNQI